MFRHAEDRLPVALITLLFAIDVAVYLFVDFWPAVLAWGLLSMLPKGGVCAFNHHHQHVSTFHKAWANRLLEIQYALMTGVSSQAWVLHHSLGHHLNYLDQTKDESRWARDDGSRMGEWEYAWITTLTAYPRAWEVSKRHPRERRIFWMMALVTLAVVSALVAYKPVNGLIMFVMVPAVMLFGTALATYAHHSDRETSHHFVACNNIIQPFYNALTGNLGYHTAHHYRPGMHWSKLPALHAEILPNIPKEAFNEPGVPWKFFGESEGVNRPATPPVPAE